MKTAVIYHKADLDGVFSAAIFKDYEQSKGDDVVLFPYNYNEAIPVLDGFDKVVVVDMSFDGKTEEVLDGWEKKGMDVVWIDHHRTAVVDKNGEPVAMETKGLRMVGKGAMELSWNYLYPETRVPQLIKYLSAYDVWDMKRFPWEDTYAIETAMQAKVGLDVDRAMIAIDSRWDMKKLIELGNRIIQAKKSAWEGYCMMFAFEGKLAGRNAVFMNTNAFSSEVFESVWDEEKYDVMVPFCVEPNGNVRFSIYTTKEGVLANEIARMFGGGGHDKAAGFSITNPYVFARFIEEHELG